MMAACEMASIIGWIGSICFALCGTPQAFQCIRQGHARGLSPLFLALWGAGEMCYIAAVLIQFGWVGWMMVNYTFNLICVFIMVRYRLWPRSPQ